MYKAKRCTRLSRGPSSTDYDGHALYTHFFDGDYTTTPGYELARVSSVGEVLNRPGTYTDGPTTMTIVGPVASIGAIPEPATWALFILGFGIIGCALRPNKARKRTLLAF